MIHYGYANLRYFKFLTKYVLFRFICNLDIYCYVIVSCNVEWIKLVLVQVFASPDAVLRKLVRSYQDIH